MKTARVKVIVAIAVAMLAAACVPETGTAPAAGGLANRPSLYVPDPGMPAAAVASIDRFLGAPHSPPLIIFQFYPDKTNPAQIAAAPNNLCTSIRQRLESWEYASREPNHGGLPIRKMMVRCK